MFTRSLEFSKDKPTLPPSAPRISYLPSTHHFYLTPCQIEACSLIPSETLAGETLFFSLENKKKVVFFENASFSSLPRLLERISLLSPLNQERLDTIATVANYLAQGTRFSYVKGSAIEEGLELQFEVIEQESEVKERYLVHIPHYRTQEKIEYAKIQPKEKV